MATFSPPPLHAARALLGESLAQELAGSRAPGPAHDLAFGALVVELPSQMLIVTEKRCGLPALN